jgi:hypothetical protein
LVGVISLSAVAFLFGPPVFAHFMRMTGEVGWNWGYGNGYGQGYGWEQGYYAGYRQQEFETQYLSDDSVVGPINLPFNFYFFGNPHNQIWVSSNGLIGFDSSLTNSTSGTFPSGYSSMNGFIAGNWRDLYPPGNGVVQYQVFGTAPNRVMVVEFKDIPNCCSSGPATVSFQVHLLEANSAIEIHSDYLNTNGLTSGIQGPGGSEATYLLANGLNGSTANLNDVAWQFVPSEGYYSAATTYAPYTLNSPVNLNNFQTTAAVGG